MTKWKIRMPAMYTNIPEGGFAPRAGVALLLALLLYLIYSLIATIPALVQAFIFFAPRVASGQNMLDLINDYMSDQSTVLVSLFLTVLLILTTIFYIRRIEKRPLSTIGLKRGHIVRKYIAGFAAGVALVGLSMLPALLTQPLSWKGFAPIVSAFLVAFMIQGASEEVLFRGFLMSSISRRIGVFWAVILSSALFAAMHVVTITSLLDVVVLFLIGALLAVVTVRTDSLWAACAIHSAWNFTTGLLSPVDAGGLNLDYSVVTVGDPNAATPQYGFFGDPSYLIVVALFIAVIALVAFAGRNRLVVPRPESERVLARARRIAKTTLPQSYLAYAELIGKMVETDDAKSAALLCLVMEQGVSPQELAEAGIGREAGLAAMALVRRPGESAEERRERVSIDPVAEAVWQAQEKYAADYTARQAAENAARQYAEWQARQYTQWQVQYAEWQAKQYAQWQAKQYADWQARQEAERQAYAQRYAQWLATQPQTRQEAQHTAEPAKPPEKDGDGTLGY